MSRISLGSITTNKTSLFKVSASSSTGQSLEYRLIKGKLPPGLYVDQSGEIHGATTDVIYDLDEGITTIDASQTTFDRKFNFTILAKNKNGVITGRQQFAITENKITHGEVANLYAKARPTKSVRTEFSQFINDPDIFPEESIYRKGELKFRTDDLQFLILAGINAPDLTKVYNLMNENFYNTTLKLGDLKIGQAKNTAGQVIYEVIYIDLIDPYSGASDVLNLKSQNLGNVTFTYYASYTTIYASSPIRVSGTIDTVYINSIENMKDDLKAGLTVQNYDYLPLWMRSPQSNNETPGFKLALPIKYVKPGEANKILYKIKNESSFDFKKMSVEIDRFYINKHNGTTIDDVRIEQTETGDGSTKNFVLDQNVTTSKGVLVTIDSVGVDASAYNITELPVKSDFKFLTADKTPASDILATSDNTYYTADLDNSKTQTVLTFNTAPSNGSQIKFKRKRTTFGLREFASFDTATTTFDGGGTRFNTQPITFDNKQPEDTQLLMLRSDIMDNIIHTSKQRELIRTPI